MADEEEETPPPPYVYEGARAVGAELELSVGDKKKTITLLGAKEGAGKAAYPNGDSYVGNYAADKRSGEGTYSYAAQPPPAEGEEPLPPVATYEGMWANGKKENVGKMTYAGGASYHGKFKNNKRDGVGTFYYANGDIYTGGWQAGSKHGQGVYIYKKSGAQIKGEWESGVMVEGTFTDKFGCFFSGKFGGEAAQPLFPDGAMLSEPLVPVSMLPKAKAKRKAFMDKQRHSWRPPPKPKDPARPKVDWHKLNLNLPSGRGPATMAARDKLFDSLDVNGDGALGYKEVEKKLVALILGSEDPSDHVCDPSLAVRSAFDTAKFQHQERLAHGHGLKVKKGYEAHAKKGSWESSHMSEMVERIEFRLMLSYLRLHFELLVMFDIVDDSDDGLITYDEFTKFLPDIEKWGIKVYNPRVTFSEIDEDKRGTVDFDEFREWALLKNLDLDDDEDAEDADKAGHAKDGLHAHAHNEGPGK